MVIASVSKIEEKSRRWKPGHKLSHRIAGLFTSILRKTNEVTKVDSPSTKADNGEQNKQVRVVVKLVRLMTWWGWWACWWETKICQGPENRKKSAKSGLAWDKRLNLTKANVSGTDFLIPEAKRAFAEASILQHFESERFIWIEKIVSGLTIGGVISQIFSDQGSSDHVNHGTPNSSKASKIGKWLPVALFLGKTIPIETRYETYNLEFIAIVETFKSWRHYPDGYKSEFFVLTDYRSNYRYEKLELPTGPRSQTEEDEKDTLRNENS